MCIYTLMKYPTHMMISITIPFITIRATTMDTTSATTTTASASFIIMYGASTLQSPRPLWLWW